MKPKRAADAVAVAAALKDGPSVTIYNAATGAVVETILVDVPPAAEPVTFWIPDNGRAKPETSVSVKPKKGSVR